MLAAFITINANAETIHEKYGKLDINIKIPKDYIRIDNSDTDVAQIIKAGVPKTNYLFAGLANKSSLLGKTGGVPQSLYPYILVQTMKAAAINGVSADLMRKLRLSYETSGGDFIETIDSVKASEIRTRIGRAAEARAGSEVKILKPIIVPAGVISKSKNHATILAFGKVKALSKNTNVEIDVVATMTLIEVDGLPVFLYVYAKDKGDKQSVNKVAALTQKVRSGISSAVQKANN